MLTVSILLQSAMPQEMQLIIVLVFLACFTIFVLYLRHDSNKHLKNDLSPKTEPSDTVDDYIAMHGEPEAEYVLDATRSNELAAVVLLYEKEIVVDGKAYDRDTITDVTFNNAANPYVASDYQLVLTTTLHEKPTIKVAMGSDAERAKELAADIAQHFAKE